MKNKDFWDSIQRLISDGFDSKGLYALEEYADKFINGELVFKRFSPKEQYGCAEGGSSHVIATILAGAETSADSVVEGNTRLKGIFQLGAQQAALIEAWARKAGVWIENVDQTLADNMGGFPGFLRCSDSFIVGRESKKNKKYMFLLRPHLTRNVNAGGRRGCSDFVARRGSIAGYVTEPSGKR